MTMPRISSAARASRTADRPTPREAASWRSAGSLVPTGMSPLVKNASRRSATSETTDPCSIEPRAALILAVAAAEFSDTSKA